MIIALTDDQLVVFQVLGQYVPRVVARVFQTADAEPLALADGVIHQSMMVADDFAFGRLDLAGLGGQVLLEKVAETTLTDEADAGGVFFLCCGQFVFFRDGAHGRFFQLADREQGLGDLLAAHSMQEVTLVLVRVQAFEQFGAAVDVATTDVMACSDQVCAEHHGVIEKCLELDLAVAKDVRVGRTSGFVFSQEMLEHVVPVLGGKVGGVQFDADFVAHGLRIGQVFAGGAIVGSVVFLPVLHEQAFHLIALLNQQEGRDGRVHAAGHTDNDAGPFWIMRSWIVGGWITHRNSMGGFKKDAILTGRDQAVSRSKPKPKRSPVK